MKKFAKYIAILSILTVFGAISTSANAAQNTPAKNSQIEKLKTQGQKEINRREASLDKMVSKLNAAKKISDADKSALLDSAQSEITALKSIKEKISTSTDLTAVKADVKSITESYRTYALFLPKSQIVASADRLLSITDSIATSTLAKIQDRITKDKSAGKDTASIDSKITTVISKISDVKTQAENAISKVSPLSPDNGDKTIAAANKKVLKDAGTIIKAGEKELISIKQAITAILSDIKKLERPAKTSGTATSTATKTNN